MDNLSPESIDAPEVSSQYFSNPLEIIPSSLKALVLQAKSLILTFLLFVVAPLLLIGAAVIYFFVSHHSAAGAVAMITTGIIFLLSLALSTGAWTILLLAAARGQKVGVGDAFRRGVKFSGILLLAGLLTFLAIVGGFILLIIPGYIFLAWFYLTQFVVIDEKLGPVAAMKRSKQLVKGRVVEILGLIALPQVFSAILSLLPFLSLYASGLSLVLLPAPAIRYLQLKQIEKSTYKPPVHTINYWLIAAAIVGTILASVLRANGWPNARPTKPGFFDLVPTKTETNCFSIILPAAAKVNANQAGCSVKATLENQSIEVKPVPEATNLQDLFTREDPILVQNFAIDRLPDVSYSPISTKLDGQAALQPNTSLRNAKGGLEAVVAYNSNGYKINAETVHGFVVTVFNPNLTDRAAKYDNIYLDTLQFHWR